jgi:hypothetical protein
VFELGTKCASPSRLWHLVPVPVVLVVASRAQAAAASDEWNENDAELANDPPPPPPPPPSPLTPLDKLLTASLVFELELRGSIGWGVLADDDGSLAELTTGGGDLMFTMGAFVTPHLRMGYVATAGRRTVLASQPGERGAGPIPSELEADAKYLLPLGIYAALYPLGDASLSLGVDLGLGISWGAEFMGYSFLLPPWAGTAAVHVGYDLVWSHHLAWGVRARCGKLGFSNSDDDGHTTTLGSTELGLAVHLSAF